MNVIQKIKSMRPRHVTGYFTSEEAIVWFNRGIHVRLYGAFRMFRPERYARITKILKGK